MKVRLNFDVPQADRDALTGLARMRRSTMTATVLRALEVLSVLTAWTMAGGSVVLRDQAGKEKEIVL